MADTESALRKQVATLRKNVIFEERVSDHISRQWRWIHLVTSWLAAATATGSTFAGLAFWNTPTGEAIWGALAFLAALTSVLRAGTDTANVVRKQTELASDFKLLRVEIEELLDGLAPQAAVSHEVAYQGLSTKYKNLLKSAGGSVLYTKAVAKRIQKDLEEEFSRERRENRIKRLRAPSGEESPKLPPGVLEAGPDKDESTPGSG